MKTAEEYYDMFSTTKDLINGIISDAQAEIDALKASQLQPLPEEMPEELPVLVGGMGHAQSIWNNIRQRYGTPWWAKLKEGDKFNGDGRTWTFDELLVTTEEGRVFDLDEVSPYTGPTAAEARAKLSDEEYDALKKQWYQEMHKNDLSAELAEQAEAEAKYREGGR